MTEDQIRDVIAQWRVREQHARAFFAQYSGDRIDRAVDAANWLGHAEETKRCADELEALLAERPCVQEENHETSVQSPRLGATTQQGGDADAPHDGLAHEQTAETEMRTARERDRDQQSAAEVDDIRQIIDQRDFYEASYRRKCHDLQRVLAERPQPPPTMADAAEMLWVVLANVSGGDWTKQSAEWQEAAARWRDYYFAALKHETAERPPPQEAQRCEGRYPAPQTSPPREEPFEVTYRCALVEGHQGPHGSEPLRSPTP